MASVGVDLQVLGMVLEEKLAAKGMTPEAVSRVRLLGRQVEFERDWERNLAYLLPREQTVSFIEAWSTVLDLMDAAEGALQDRAS